MRDISQPTCISICICDDSILLEDLSGKRHILGKEDLEKIGKKIIDIAKNKDLPNLELATLKIGPEKIETSNITAEEFSPDNLIQLFIKYGPSILNKVRGG